MDGKIVETQKAIAAYLKDKLPSLQRLEMTAGAFNEDEVKRLVTTSDTVHLGFLGTGLIEQEVGGPLRILAAYGAYIAVTGRDRVHRGTNTLEAVAIVLAGAGHGDDDGLGVTFTEPVRIGEIQNLYDKEAGSRGVAIYALSFMVPITLGKETFGGDIDVLDQMVRMSGPEGDPVIMDPTNTKLLEPVHAQP